MNVFVNSHRLNIMKTKEIGINSVLYILFNFLTVTKIINSKKNMDLSTMQMIKFLDLAIDLSYNY
jgi:hypothetical protein